MPFDFFHHPEGWARALLEKQRARERRGSSFDSIINYQTHLGLKSVETRVGDEWFI